MRNINENPNMSMKKTSMAMLPLEERIHTSEEVCLGFTEEEALAEASRCLNCPYQYCHLHCPTHNHIPEFIEQIRNKDYEAAWEILSKTNAIMDISCRVCPYEKQCESHCTRAIKGEPVAIGALERFVSDYHKAHSEKPLKECKEKNGFKVAVIGGGPAGITCAISLALSGFQVSLYEKTNQLGGVTSWGIPSFVLPKDLMAEHIQNLHNYHVDIHLNTEVGVDISLKALKEENDALFLAIGAEKPIELDIPDSHLPQVIQAKDYLCAPEKYPYKNILVIGGGNTAIDAARTALRQKSTEESKILYRRTKADMPASHAEIALAEEEGIKILPLLSPSAFLTKNQDGDEDNLYGIRCDLMEVASPDYPGGRNNVAPSGKTEEIPCDLVILALGFQVRPMEEIHLDSQNRILINDDMETSSKMIFAGGDCVSGPATLIKASAAGKEAAAHIFDKLPLY